MLRSPFHPGRFLRQWLQEHEVSQTRLSRHIGVGIGVINQICNEKRGISAGMALKLSQALGTTPELWLNLQCAYELGKEPSVVHIRPLVRVA